MTTRQAKLATIDISRNVTPLLQAGRDAFGMGRTATYRAVKDGTFPVRVIKAGGRWVVPTRELCEVLGIDLPDEATTR